MATYYPSSNNQRDATPMLYLREPLPNPYVEAPVLPSNMMMYANYSCSSGSYPMAGNSEQQNNCVEFPCVMGASDSTQPQQEILSNLGVSHAAENDYNAWRDGRNEMLFMQPMGAPSGIVNVNGGSQNLQGQGLSLSLSTQIPLGIQMPSAQFRNPNSAFSSFLSPHMSVAAGEGSVKNGSCRDDENSLNKQSSNAEYLPHDSTKVSMYGMSTTIGRAVLNSKYLKAAQQLLDEVVNVWKASKLTDSEKKNCKEGDGGLLRNGAASPSVSEGPLNTQESSGNSHNTELSPAERQDLQNKLTKLLSMLDEVDRRYKQYYHQMHIVVSSFDVIAGCGAAKAYTVLALQTISRHFRCLRDAITGQIRVARKNLGEENVSTNGRGVRISRLRYVDQQLRQQRALQQLGMTQHTWRPQRGLPETSVSILRAWLFEHFLHPYPKDSDKIMLARQAGLTRSQVSNWFINARVRLWKPMVEDMYKEEIGDVEMDSNSSSENASKATRDGDPQVASEDRGQDVQQSIASTATNRCAGQFFDTRSDLLPTSEISGSVTGITFQNSTHNEAEAQYGVVKLRGEHRPDTDNCSLYPDAIAQSGGGSERFMAATPAYQMSELGRFGNGGGVSLTLGLQHCDGASLPTLRVAHHGVVTMRRNDV